MKGESRFMWLALLTSSSTLVCCALPALMISLGAGVALSSMLSIFPALIWVSMHKGLVFSCAAAMLTFGGWLQSRPASCPLEPELAKACARYKRISKVVYGCSVGFFATGGFFAFVAPKLFH